MGRFRLGVGLLLMLGVTLIGATTARAGDDRIVYTCASAATGWTPTFA